MSLCIAVPDVMTFPVCVTEISHSQEHKVTVTLTFGLRPPKSNQFIFESKGTFVQHFKIFT